jgi:DNA ligase (NAD+)
LTDQFQHSDPSNTPTDASSEDALRAKFGEEHAQKLAEIEQAQERLLKAGFAKATKKKTGAGFTATVGPVVAKAVEDYFQSDLGKGVLKRLRTLGINPKGHGQKGVGGHPFAGKTLVLTGSLTTITRGEAGERIRAVGGNVSSSVSKKTDFLVVGENAGSKLDEARAAGVKELDEATFISMLNSGGETGAGAAGEAQPELSL